jgi:hypothetical protein
MGGAKEGGKKILSNHIYPPNKKLYNGLSQINQFHNLDYIVIHSIFYFYFFSTKREQNH